MSQLKDKANLPLIAISVIVTIVFLTFIYLYYDMQKEISDIDNSLGETQLNEMPQDFQLSFEWGACQEEASRVHFRVSADGQAYLLLLEEGHRTGKEDYYSLSKDKLEQLYRVFVTNHLFSLPDEIVAPEDVISLEPECSRLEITADGQTKTIDEANGINANYYRIKKAIKESI